MCDPFKAFLLRLPTEITIKEIRIDISPRGLTEVRVSPRHPCLKVALERDDNDVTLGKLIAVVTSTCPVTVRFHGETFMAHRAGVVFRRPFYFSASDFAFFVMSIKTGYE